MNSGNKAIVLDLPLGMVFPSKLERKCRLKDTTRFGVDDEFFVLDVFKTKHFSKSMVGGSFGICCFLHRSKIIQNGRFVSDGRTQHEWVMGFCWFKDFKGQPYGSKR